MVDTFPERGLSGYAATLHVVVSHGKGETVLPRGLDLQSESDTGTCAQGRGVRVPRSGRRRGRPPLQHRHRREDRHAADDPRPAAHRAAERAGAGTRSSCPPLPVSIARANNDVVTLCTKPHTDRRRGPDRIDAGRAAEAQPAPRARSARSGSRWSARCRGAPSGSCSVGCARVAGLPVAQAPAARAAAAAAAPALGGRARASRRGPPRGAPRDAALRRVLRPRERRRARVPRRALRLRRARVDDRRDARGAAARARTSGCRCPRSRRSSRSAIS